MSVSLGLAILPDRKSASLQSICSSVLLASALLSSACGAQVDRSSEADALPPGAGLLPGGASEPAAGLAPVDIPVGLASGQSARLPSNLTGDWFGQNNFGMRIRGEGHVEVYIGPLDRLGSPSPDAETGSLDQVLPWDRYPLIEGAGALRHGRGYQARGIAPAEFGWGMWLQATDPWDTFCNVDSVACEADELAACPTGYKCSHLRNNVSHEYCAQEPVCWCDEQRCRTNTNLLWYVQIFPNPPELTVNVGPVTRAEGPPDPLPPAAPEYEDLANLTIQEVLAPPVVVPPSGVTGECADVPTRIFGAEGKCAGIICHGSPGELAVSADLGHSIEGIEQRLVGLPGTGDCSDYFMVDAADPMRSLLVLKMQEQPPCGSPMPFSGLGEITDEERACVIDWTLQVAAAASP